MEAEIIGDTFFTMHRLPARNDSVRVAEALSQLKSDHNLHNKKHFSIKCVSLAWFHDEEERL